MFSITPQLLHMSLRNAKVTSAEESALEMLDPFITLLLDCLNSMHVKVCVCVCARATCKNVHTHFNIVTFQE